ncbi:MAG: SOS response-associated peptidase family protein [Acidobacteriota bacterium]
MTIRFETPEGMCGRISQVEIDDYYNRVYRWPLPDHKPRRNIRPTEEVPILVSEANEVCGVTARWWAQPDRAKAFETKFATFNARLDRLDSITSVERSNKER